MTGCQVRLQPASSDDHAGLSDQLPLLLDDATRVAIEKLRADQVSFNLQTVITRQNSIQPERMYRYLRTLGTPHLQFIPLQERDNPQSVTDQQWGTFLSTVFDVWVREDIGRVCVQLFDSTLGVWRGSPSQYGSFDVTGDPGKHTFLSGKCQTCVFLRACNGDCTYSRVEDISALCAGYQAFFRHSAPHMRVMRDLIRHHRSPMELMAVLRQSH